ncbi:MAG: DUF6946 family protein [Candidatus Acidiferrales bacterium]
MDQADGPRLPQRRALQDGHLHPLWWPRSLPTRKPVEPLLRTVGLSSAPDGASRYQLFHRAASAVLEGERYRAVAAVMLVHSFSQERVCWPDYQAFLQLFGVRAEVGAIQRLPGAQRVPLFVAWVLGDCRFLSS